MARIQPTISDWERAIEALAGSTALLMACDPHDQAEVGRLVGLRGATLAQLTALPGDCPAHLISSIEKVRDDGEHACSRFRALRTEMHSELAGLLQIRSILRTGTDPLPRVIDFTA